MCAPNPDEVYYSAVGGTIYKIPNTVTNKVRGGYQRISRNKLSKLMFKVEHFEIDKSYSNVRGYELERDLRLIYRLGQRHWGCMNVYNNRLLFVGGSSGQLFVKI